MYYIYLSQNFNGIATTIVTQQSHQRFELYLTRSMLDNSSHSSCPSLLSESLYTDLMGATRVYRIQCYCLQLLEALSVGLAHVSGTTNFRTDSLLECLAKIEG